MLKYFKDCKTAEELKQAYKRLVHQLHPDCNTEKDTTADFQNMQSEFEACWSRLKDIHVNKDGEMYQSRTETTETAAEFMDIIDKLIHIPNINIELCGSWLWITGDTKPAKDILKMLKFRWSPKKSAWYFHFGEYRKKSKKIMTMDQIRFMYGSNAFTDDEPEPMLA